MPALIYIGAAAAAACALFTFVFLAMRTAAKESFHDDYHVLPLGHPRGFILLDATGNRWHDLVRFERTTTG